MMESESWPFYFFYAYVYLVTVHKSGQLETLLEDNGVIPKIDLKEEPAKA